MRALMSTDTDMRMARGLTAILLSLAAAQAVAQTAPDAGGILRQQQPPTIVLPAQPPPALELPQPAAPPRRVEQDFRFTLNGWRLLGQETFTTEQLLKPIQELVGKEVGFEELEQAAARVSRFYREHGFLVARAYLPAQDIRDGIVEIRVLEGRLGQVVIENHSRVRDRVIRSRMDGLQGHIVRDGSIESRLRLTYELNGIGPASQAALQSGARVGETDLLLKLDSDSFVTGVVRLDNYGNHFTGSNQLSAQLNFNSPTHSGDLLSLQGTAGLQGRPNAPGLGLYRVSYDFPVTASGLIVGAEYSRLGYHLGRDFAALQASGTSNTWLAFASHPLALGRTYSVNVRLSYQRSSIEDRIDSTATLTDKSTRLGGLAIIGDWHDGFGGGGASAVSLNYGFGTLDIASPDARAIDDASLRTDGSYQKWNLSATRLQHIAKRVSLYVSATGQKAQKNLDSSEKLILGGPYGIKAYPEGEGSGDTGYIVSAELRFELSRSWIPGHTQLLVLADTGAITILQSPFVSGPNYRRLHSAGVGLNWYGAQNLRARLLVAHQVGGAPALSDTDKSIRGWLQVYKIF
jgi:hemolysin activation/secretion protein